MKIATVTAATTNLDRSGERLTKADLEVLAAQSSEYLIPIFNNHDHALPPIGRQIKAEVVPVGDGEHALRATFEIWQPGDATAPDKLGREVAIRRYDEGKYVVAIDKPLEGKEFYADILALNAAGFNVNLERRKAFTPISILLLGVGIIGTGILREIGKECWNLAKVFVKKVRTQEPEKAKRVIFAITIRGAREVEVDVVLDDPTPEMIDKLFDHGFSVIEKALDELPADTARVVFRGDTPLFELKYTVDQNGFPSHIDDVDLESFGGVSIGFAASAQAADGSEIDATIKVNSD